MQGPATLDSSPPSRHQACYQLANYLLCGSSYIDLRTWFFSLCSATQSADEEQGEEQDGMVIRQHCVQR